MVTATASGAKVVGSIAGRNPVFYTNGVADNRIRTQNLPLR
jgi:hypothetical protein